MKNHLNAIFLLLLYFSPSYTESKSRKSINCGLPPSEQVYMDHQPTERHVYIVYLGEHSGKKTFHEIEHDHHSYLHSVKGSIDEVKASIIYSYKNVVNGFSALLTPEEAARLSDMEEVRSVFKSNSREYHTTRSWEFVNLLEQVGNSDSSHSSYEEDLLPKANSGQNIIVGVMDSGVWPESESFNDEGMEPIPKSWNGTCQQGVAFNSSHCNRKLIGARYYLRGFEQRFGPLNNSVEYRSPRDRDGHGTHTASTIGGRRVANISVPGGFANGTAVGGAPMVRLAIYKVCWVRHNTTSVSCRDDDILAGFDDAISDGVNVISASIGALRNLSFIDDGIAIGAWHAERRNIVVVCSAGNNGPAPSTVTNVAPWILTVGSSSIDRIFSSPILLGNGARIRGQTITQPKLQNMHSLVYAGDVEVPSTNLTSGLCLPNTLIPDLVRGKVVFCRRGIEAQAFEVRRAGGVGAILGDPRSSRQGIEQVNNFVLPATVVFANDTNQIISYIRSSENATVTLTPATTLLDTKPAPFMAQTSSTGPNSIQPNILKPDITAPGLNILAAWTEGTSLSSLPNDTRVVKYNIISGTSMACPHVAAVAALLKAIHPDWSSASIRSAIMTTATVNDNTGSPITDHNGNPATPFNYGAGHFQPRRAVDPGLVYNTTERDYNLYLCKTEIDFLDLSVVCPENLPPPSNLNYPSLAIADLNGTMTVERTVTNVGTLNSTYTSNIIAPDGYSVEISPKTLQFLTLGETKSFNITVTSRMSTRNGYAFGWYMWSDGIHVVRSPIAVSSL